MTTEKEIIRKRLREVGEPIATSPQLREALTDEQATELIDWGMAVLERAVQEMAVQPDSKAMPELEQKATAVSLIMQLVNQLIENPESLPEEDDVVNSRLVRLGKNLYWLTGRKRETKLSKKFAAFEAIRETADSPVLFRHLMSIIEAYTNEEADT